MSDKAPALPRDMCLFPGPVCSALLLSTLCPCSPSACTSLAHLVAPPGQPHVSLKTAQHQPLQALPSPGQSPQAERAPSTHLGPDFPTVHVCVSLQVTCLGERLAQSKCDRGVCCCYYHPCLLGPPSTWSDADAQCTSVRKAKQIHDQI